MKRLIWLPAAGFLLVAGAAVAAAAPGVMNTASSVVRGGVAALDDGALAVHDDGTIKLHVEGPDALLSEVLTELVADDVITQEQAEAITGALATRAEERRAEFEAEAERVRALWEQIQGFLEDGVISADEMAQLPEDNPFSAIEGILEDGQVTLDELQSLRPFGEFRAAPGFGPGFGPGRGGHGGHGGPDFGHDFGPRMWLPIDPDTNSEASPDVQPTSEPSSTT